MISTGQKVKALKGSFSEYQTFERARLEAAMTQNK